MSTLGLLLGGSWSSGINLYLTVAGLGILHRMDYITLPGNLDTIANPLVIAVALILFAIEFLADKIPYVDSVWDSVHTFIRPAGGMALGYLAMGDASPAIQVPVALLTGSISLDSHLTKATSRAVINTSPEPISNSVASVTEDVSVLGVMYFIIAHPVITCVFVVAFILFSIWFLTKMFKFLKKVLQPKRPENADQPQRTGQT